MELQWIGVAFVLGFVARRLQQPPLLGFLAAGFVLELVGVRPDASLHELADVGVLLLLFTIGLKVDTTTIVRREVWATTLLHVLLVTVTIGGALYGLLGWGLLSMPRLELGTAMVLGFALSFSSTVLVAKVLEERDDMGALYGRIAIGVLVVQDLLAVAYLAVQKDHLPSPLALALLLFYPLRRGLFAILERVGHGEMLVLFGLALALGGAALFEGVGLKGDLGALAAGALIGGHAKGKELFDSLAGLKDLFLVGFFLSVGLMGLPTVETVLVGLALLAFVPLKVALFYAFFARWSLRARTSFLATLSLATYSEFGLIVSAMAASSGLLDERWVVAIAVALSASFLLVSPANVRAYELYDRLRDRLLPLQREVPIDEEKPMDARAATTLIFGMGRVGAGAYDALVEHHDMAVLGFDVDPRKVAEHKQSQREVMLGSATDRELWDRLHLDPERTELILLALSSHQENLFALEQIRSSPFDGVVAAVARYPDEVDELVAHGCDVAFPLLAEAGAGFAEHVMEAVAAPGVTAAHP